MSVVSGKDMQMTLNNYLCGKYLGRGIYRKVYVFEPNPRYVIKIGIGIKGKVMNVLEYKLWQDIEFTPFENHFARIKSMWGVGDYLIQERLDMTQKEKYPSNILAFFTDIKYSNFGFTADGRFVCSDYGSFNIFKGHSVKRMQKAFWV